MRSKQMAILLSVATLIAVAFVPAHAQRHPGPGGPGPGGFGWGPGDGFRVLGMGGCFFAGPDVMGEGYAATVTYEHTQPVVQSGSTITIDEKRTETVIRNNNGVTYRVITIPPVGGTGTARSRVCVSDPANHISFVVDPDKMTATEFMMPDRKPPAGNGPRPDWNKGGNGNGNTNPNVTVARSAQTISVPGPALASLMLDVTQITRLLTVPTGNGQTSQISIVSQRSFSPLLKVETGSQTTDPLRGNSTVTVVFSSTGDQDLGKQVPPYPLPSTYSVKVVEEHGRGRGGPGGPHGPHGGPGGPQPPAQP